MITGIQLEQGLFMLLRFTAIAGFITASTLLINLNHKAFLRLSKNRSIAFWGIFSIMAIIPLLLIIYLFNLFFYGVGRL